MPRQLKVDLAELAEAFDAGTMKAKFYLDLETGQTAMVTDEIRSELEEIYEDIYTPEGEERILAAEAIQQRDLPDWMKETLVEADQVDTGFGTRYVEIPRLESHEAYQDMEASIETVQDQRLQNHLWRAIEGRGAFRRFKDTLVDYPAERERWFAFKGARLRERVLEWLESLDIEPIID